jgi:hypothetical protein
MSILKKRRRMIGEKFPMRAPIAQMRAELKQKPPSSKPESQSDVGAPGDGLVQPLPGEREPMFL